MRHICFKKPCSICCTQDKDLFQIKRTTQITLEDKELENRRRGRGRKGGGIERSLRSRRRRRRMRRRGRNMHRQVNSLNYFYVPCKVKEGGL